MTSTNIELGGRVVIDSAQLRLLQVRCRVPSGYVNSLVLIAINSAIDTDIGADFMGAMGRSLHG